MSSKPLGTPAAILTIWSFMQGYTPNDWESIKELAAKEINEILRERIGK